MVKKVIIEILLVPESLDKESDEIEGEILRVPRRLLNDSLELRN